MSGQLPHQKKQFVIILTFIFLEVLGISIPYLIFPPLFLNHDYSFLPTHWASHSRALFLGVTLAAYPIGKFIGSPILGSLSDDYGRKKILSGTLLVATLSNLLSGIAIGFHSLILLILSRFISGLMEGNIAIARAMCSDLESLSKHKTFGKINASASIAYLIGPILGGLLADSTISAKFTASTPFYMTSLLFLFLSVLSYISLTESVATRIEKKQTLIQRLNFVSRLSILFANKKLKLLLITSTLFTLAVDILYEFGPVYLTTKWMLSPTQLTYYSGLLCIFLAIGSGWLPIFVTTRCSHFTAIILALGSFAALIVGLLFINTQPLMLLFYGLCGLSIGLAVTVITVKISDSASKSLQGEVMGVQLSLRVLGDGLICLSGGALLILSPKIILALAATLSLLTILYFKKSRVIEEKT